MAPQNSAQSRNKMPREGKQLRAELYRDGNIPDLAAKLEMYKYMCSQIEGISEWYTFKTHWNWCWTIEKKLGGIVYPGPAANVVAAIAAEMAACPDPTLSVLAAWARNLNVPYQVVRDIAASIAGVL
ncbi:hypothetical protein OH76DRAFT_1398799 [Lentinus brumalis]|uniref:Uncharacterized protein n=1 Tax=Lentinus brumalis TaxID=2498619 RepID=A0A371DMC8_9APHY|nr:hypothetical protein OH76DRAFT_1398799 [Polyporus brumalis]